MTNTPRSAVEQLLLTGAVDKALEKIDLDEVRGRKLFLDFSNLQAYDAPYVKTALRARFCRLGSTLVEKADEADLVAEVASGASGTEFKSSVLGMPALPVPNSPVPLPEAALYKHKERTGILKLLVFIHDKGRFVCSHTYYAKVDRNENFILWWRIRGRDEVREGWEKADLALPGGRDTVKGARN
jgi:hypothetical protein